MNYARINQAVYLQHWQAEETVALIRRALMVISLQTITTITETGNINSAEISVNHSLENRPANIEASVSRVIVREPWL
ncbi:hypothetical protein SAMN05428978_10436 [Nitrosomonas sp. Nm34]|nr:hypothetical protein SAMN05428978_10436 [Nitrosomonas sp. Nm34]